MAVGNKFNTFIENLYDTYFDGQTVKAYFTNTLPAATNGVKADVAEIAAGGGYVAGGLTVPVLTSSQTGGSYSLTTGQVVFTATGNVATFNYVVFYVSSRAGEPLVQWYQTETADVTMVADDVFTIQAATLRTAS